jgi:hypothetical protein
MLAVLAVGVAIRVVAMLAYRYAFFFPDGQQYLTAAAHHGTDPRRPIGYSLFLVPFVHHDLILVALFQHLLIIGFAVVCYLYLLRRGVRAWMAALATAPLLLGPSEVVLEHFVLAETVFTVLTVAGLMMLTRSAPGTGSSRRRLVYPAAAGVLLAYAAVTRTVGLPICVVGLAYLLIRIRTVGWRALAAYALMVAVTLGGYVGLYHSQHGVYAFGQYQGRFLYSRVMTFVHCDNVPAADKRLCSPVAIANRPALPEAYIWRTTSPASVYEPGVANDGHLTAFAMNAIEKQPLDYLATIARETTWMLVPPLRPDVPSIACHDELWIPAARVNNGCDPYYYLPVPLTAWPIPQAEAPATAATTTLSGYGRSQIAYGPLLGLAMLGTFVLVIVRFRRGDRALLGDGLLFAVTALGLLVTATATSMYELRYSIPAIPVACVGLALAVRGARSAVVVERSVDEPTLV